MILLFRIMNGGRLLRFLPNIPETTANCAGLLVDFTWLEVITTRW